MQNIKINLTASIIAIAAFASFKFWNHSGDGHQLRAKLLEICSDNKSCSKAVDSYFDSCFQENYQPDRQVSHVNHEAFLVCFTEKSGKTFFSYSED